MTILLSTFDAEVAAGDDDADLLSRVGAEFQEMPDLAVTIAEAARLFAVDLPRCRRILERLVARGVLATDGRCFANAGTGRRNT
jgi:hypothetical protein